MMRQKEYQHVRLINPIEISTGEDVPKTYNPNLDTEGTQNDPDKNHDSQEDKNKFENKKPLEENTIASSPGNSTKEEPIPPPKPTWTLTFLNVDENQGDSVGVSYLNNGKPTSISPTKKGQRWEFRIPADISTVKVDCTKEGESGWTSLPRTASENTYDFQEFAQRLLQRAHLSNR